MTNQNNTEAIITRIEEVIDKKIRPALQMHRGDIRISNYEDGILSVKLLGQCIGCAGATETLNNLVRQELMTAVPEVSDVILDDSIPQDMMNFAKQILKNNI